MARSIMVLLLIGWAAAETNVVKRCLLTCHNRSSRPVCGTDNITYQSRCHLRCTSPPIGLKHRGKCKPRLLHCQADLAYAQKAYQGSGEPNYLPSCRLDGSYAPVQCARVTGSCWCVDPQGRHIHKSIVSKSRNGKSKCNLDAKSTTKRRSSTRNRRPKRGCKRADKALFNNNLIDIFHQEWSRIHAQPSQQGGELDGLVLEWKFKDMDRDRNGVLDKTEYKDLKKLVKKVVKPKRCSKSFAKACDVDRDQQISREEWSDCLTRDGMDDDRNGADRGKEDERDEDEDDYGEDVDFDEDYSQPPRRPPPHGVLQSSAAVATSAQIYGDDSNERYDEDATDCLTDRTTVLNEQRSENMYVPECTPDGRYKKVQCYKSVGYCWCVHEDTGKNIPGTSVKNAVPKCDLIPTPNRPMKGCPEPKKTVFLKDLMEFLHSRMMSATNDTNITGSDGANAWQASREEKAATWNFVVLDKNKNKVLERKEWKAFRILVSSSKQLKRCGKKLPRYCDVNHDRKISMTEWLDCLNTKRNEIQDANVSPKPASQSRRKGPNPLESILKGDD